MKGNISVERGPDWDTTDPTSPGYQMGSRKSEHQYGLIYDLLCEGEIGGLVNGLASIYLNNTPMANGTALAASGPRVGSSTTTANNASVTVKTVFSQGSFIYHNNKTYCFTLPFIVHSLRELS